MGSSPRGMLREGFVIAHSGAISHGLSEVAYRVTEILTNLGGSEARGPSTRNPGSEQEHVALTRLRTPGHSHESPFSQLLATGSSDSTARVPNCPTWLQRAISRDSRPLTDPLRGPNFGRCLKRLYPAGTASLNQRPVNTFNYRHGAGMRVLDVGSGTGEVAFLAADFVGPSGEVLGYSTSCNRRCSPCRSIP